MPTKKLTRSRSDKYLAGVCGGLAAYSGIDATIVRIVMALVAIFVPSGFLVYALLWLALPYEDGGKSGFESLKEQFTSRSTT